ncbi:hypothetical protein ACQCVJ_25465 [Bacillus infantis]
MENKTVRNISDPLIYERAKGELLMDAPLFICCTVLLSGRVCHKNRAMGEFFPMAFYYAKKYLLSGGKEHDRMQRK